MINYIAILTKMVPFHADDDDDALAIIDEMESELKDDGINLTCYKLPVHDPMGGLDFGDQIH